MILHFPAISVYPSISYGNFNGYRVFKHTLPCRWMITSGIRSLSNQILHQNTATVMTRLVRQCDHAILFHQHHWEALPLWQLQASYENPHVFFLRNYPFWVASFWTFVKVKTSQSSKIKKTRVSGYKNDTCPMFFHVFLFVVVFSSNFRKKIDPRH